MGIRGWAVDDWKAEQSAWRTPQSCSAGLYDWKDFSGLIFLPPSIELRIEYSPFPPEDRVLPKKCGEESLSKDRHSTDGLCYKLLFMLL